MKVSDIIIYIMKTMGFDFKKIRSSSFRDKQKSAESQREKRIFSILLTYGLLHTFIVITGTASPFPGEYTIRKNRPQK